MRGVPGPAPAASSALPAADTPGRRYWRRTRQVTATLSGAWFVTTFGVIFFARELSGYELFGWPFSYYMVAQGTTLIYLAIVGLYAWRMAWLDRRLERETRHDA